MRIATRMPIARIIKERGMFDRMKPTMIKDVKIITAESGWIDFIF